MNSLEGKFCKWSDYTYYGGCSVMEFDVIEWTEYSKTLIENGGGEVEDYTIFVFDSSGKIFFMTDSGEGEIS